MYSREALSLGSHIGQPSPTKVDSHRYHNFITKLISLLPPYVHILWKICCIYWFSQGEWVWSYLILWYWVVLHQVQSLLEKIKNKMSGFKILTCTSKVPISLLSTILKLSNPLFFTCFAPGPKFRKNMSGIKILTSTYEGSYLPIVNKFCL